MTIVLGLGSAIIIAAGVWGYYAMKGDMYDSERN